MAIASATPSRRAPRLEERASTAHAVDRDVGGDERPDELERPVCWSR